MPLIPDDGVPYLPLAGRSEEIIAQVGIHGGPEKTGTIIYQPKFDDRIMNVLHWGGVPISRGVIRTDPAGAIAAHKNLGLRFLYNPTELSESANVDPNAQTGDTKDKDDLAKNIGAFVTFSFSLLFDRTYELWSSEYMGTDVGTLGVYTDIRQLYAMLGMIPSSAIFTKEIVPPESPMSAVPCWFFFGNQYGDKASASKVKKGASNRSLIYYGRIDSLSVDYTSWTESMTPRRAVVNMSCQTLPPPGRYQEAVSPMWSDNYKTHQANVDTLDKANAEAAAEAAAKANTNQGRTTTGRGGGYTAP